MNLTDKDKLIIKLKQNGFIKEISPAGLIVYSKQFSRKHVIITLRTSVFEKVVVQLTDDGSSKNIYRYSEFNDVRLN